MTHVTQHPLVVQCSRCCYNVRIYSTDTSDPCVSKQCLRLTEATVLLVAYCQKCSQEIIHTPLAGGIRTILILSVATWPDIFNFDSAMFVLVWRSDCNNSNCFCGLGRRLGDQKSKVPRRSGRDSLDASVVRGVRPRSSRADTDQIRFFWFGKPHSGQSRRRICLWQGFIRKRINYRADNTKLPTSGRLVPPDKWINVSYGCHRSPLPRKPGPTFNPDVENSSCRFD